MVTRLHGCLGALTPESQRLLSLRAGLGGTPRSATATARILHLGQGRERMIEQLSLVSLQSLGAGGCASTGSAGTTSQETSLPVVNQLSSTAPALLAASTGSTPGSSPQSAAGASAARPGSPQGSHSSGSSHSTSHSTRPIVITPAAKRTVESLTTSSHLLHGLAIGLFALLVLGISLVLLPGVRRRLMAIGPSSVDAVDSAGAAGTSAVASPSASPAASGTSTTAGVSAAGVVAAAQTKTARGAAAETAGPTAQAETNGAAAPAVVAGPPTSGHPLAAHPGPQLEPHNSNRQPNGQPARRRAPEPSPATSRSRAGWARDHAAQAALVATVIVGGAARSLGRGRTRRR